MMQKMLHPYSMDFNHKYSFTGYLFESRTLKKLVLIWQLSRQDLKTGCLWIIIRDILPFAFRP